MSISGMAGAIDFSCGTRTDRMTKMPNITERPDMKTSRYFALLTVTLLPLLPGNSQTANPSAASQANAPSNLSSGAAEVAKLAQSGVSDDVVRAFIGQSQSVYNLSAANIAALKNAGVSSQALTAMLNHDSALRTQQQSSSPAAATPASPQTTVTQSDSASATATANPTSANPTAVAPTSPPTPQVEVIPVSPEPDYLWTPGWWSWNGDAWIWFGGYWGYPSRPGHVWFNGHFYHGRGVESVRGHRR
jgi:hypothetical protein